MKVLKHKFARVVAASALGSLLWAGCTGPRTYTYYGDATTEVQPVDLTQRRADTYPAGRTGLDASHGGRVIVHAPYTTIVEGAGAGRP